MKVNARTLPKILGAGLIVAALVALIMQPAGGGAAGWGLPILLVTIGLWSGGFLPDHVTALGFFAVLLLFKLAPPEVVLSGFTSSALWLVLAGLVLGLAMDETGLGKRMAGLARGLEGLSYPRLVAVVVGLGLAAIFFMPSATGRIIMLLGIVAPLAVHLGYHPGSRGYSGLMLAAAFGTFLPAFSVLPSNVPNMVLAGTLEKLTGHSFTFVEFFIVHFPVLGVGRALAVWALVCLLYAEPPGPLVGAGAAAPGPLSKGERRLAAVLLLAVSLWVTDSWHHISPAWVALAGAVLCLYPRFGVLGADAMRKLNMSMIFHVGAVIGLGAVANHLGLGAWMAEAILGWMPLSGDGHLHDWAVLVILPMLLGVLTTAPGVPAVLVPMAGTLAARSGFSIDSVAMLQVPGLSTILLPHQVPPLMAAVPVSGVPYHEFVRMCLLTAGVSVVILLPLDALWWMVLGRL
ncbi:SLC13 family permease [Magnetospirillum gryphiswaldense]|uniref:Sodium/solute symporter family protein n=1 Tax=Magnetospirillum gryphiswaldense TaxID=55518 RepID=A4U4U2_9PROT|nr:SLC13 family permease [Magnetospirillum gryphiswaldense]AVM72720.1 Citrate carrier [Magnetospirillum gryphiswaldense MSR-1]AVM76623.1 Citrate carrier [Magnetospirillum gryphiswaldense]CAM77899.1 sodium/solute symporter family protein [Magnetospirillum gryphiswaldense MSR-1]